uniref:uncharacterized protein LOC100184694 isoform X2 n=1 Tax=Ciona intestinalis TaxID=7719 RepID=UPI000EF4C05E|nr:uncharacterized protein LOC100184694 isoform X2 [Ciona intestinalis]|eukprot:XP_026696217.1 uncharacterized protein LOC100184694 isoform X2 [Ciona intestinalis]
MRIGKTEPKRMRIDAFLRNYTEHQWYTVSMMPEDMRKDIKVPKPLMCSTFRYNLQELNLWIGTKGTRSMLHHDADNIFHCLVTGRKDWILINADQRAKIDMVLQRSNAGSGFSHLNVDNVDLFEHHELSQVPWEYATLYAGDCLYLPSQYTHQVRSYNRSISSTFLSFPRDTFDDSDCSDVDLDSYLSLDDVYVYWVYEKGQETVNMGYGNPEDTITVFRNLYELLKVDKLALNGFFYAGFVASGQGVMEKVDDVKAFFEKSDTNNDSFLDKTEFYKIPMNSWKAYCRLMDNPHGPTKSELNINAEKTNASAAFNPRNNDYWFDSRAANACLRFMVEQHGNNGKVLPFHVFKSNMETIYEGVDEAFSFVDTNMDGLLHLSEIVGLSQRALRRFYYTAYRYIGSGDFPAAAICKHGGNEEEKTMEETHMAVEVLISLLEDFPETGEITLQDFKQRMLGTNHFDKKFNFNFVFGVLDTENDRLLSRENLEHIIYGTENIYAKKFMVPPNEMAVVPRERQNPVSVQSTYIRLVEGVSEINKFVKMVSDKRKKMKRENAKEEL